MFFLFSFIFINKCKNTHARILISFKESEKWYVFVFDALGKQKSKQKQKKKKKLRK